MSNIGPTKDLKNRDIPQVPSESRALLALNTAIQAARASEADKQFIAASLEIKKLADFE